MQFVQRVYLLDLSAAIPAFLGFDARSRRRQRICPR